MVSINDQKTDRDFAYEAGLAHEGLEPGYTFSKQSDDVKMDISNNYSGRKLGTIHTYSTDSEISSAVISDCSSGYLKRTRTYTSNPTSKDEKRAGVWTRYKGYYVASSSGGLK